MQENQSGIVFQFRDKEVSLDRPKPILPEIEVLPFKKRMDPQIAIQALIEGQYVLVVDYFSSGLYLLSELKKHLLNTYSDSSFRGQREFRSHYHELSNRLLLLVNNNKIVVRKAPQIGWLKVLYPDISHFLLSFPHIQGLNSSWQWYTKGVRIPVLHHPIHPFYGTYFPSRFEHLKLFEKWLKSYDGEKQSAIDIGVGSGILSFILLKNNFQKVIGTDTNPNAIFGINNLNKSKTDTKIDLFYGDLFAEYKGKTELIIFNPPWLPNSGQIEGLDTAIYYNDDLFPRFFEQAEKHLDKEGKVILLFSNLAQITNVTDEHPIRKELSEGERFQKEDFMEMEVAPSSNKTKRNTSHRSEEKVELWVLKLIEK